MSAQPLPVPVEVVFGGCHPDQKTVRLCLEAARSLSSHSRYIEACEVLVADQGREKEIRIDVRTAEGEVLVDRFTSAASEEQLRSALRRSFALVAQGMDGARGTRSRPDRAPSEDAPPCTWYG